MTRNGDRASFAWPLNVGEDATVLVVLDFDRTGHLVSLSVKRQPAERESAAEKEAAALFAQRGARLVKAGNVTELVTRATLALHALQDLAALEARHGAEARALFGEARP